MYLAQNLKYLRERNGETQKDIADLFGVKRTAINKYESGMCEPRLEKLITLADHFGATIDDLIRKDMRPPKPMYASNLKYFREKYGMTQLEIGELLNVKQTTVANYEAGRREMPLEQIMKLADYFGVTLDQFVKQDLLKEVIG